MTYTTLNVHFEGAVCYIQFARADAGNTINAPLVAEFHHALDACEAGATAVVVSGSPDVFCLGADFDGIARTSVDEREAESLYDLWLRLTRGPYVSIAQVRGKVNAGGLGFVAASDIVLADDKAHFGLSELLFGLYPACVLPFLIRRIGLHRAHYLTLTTQAVSAQRAAQWGLVDVVEPDSEASLRKHLLRLRYVSKQAVERYKAYLARLEGPALSQAKSLAVSGNVEVFRDPGNLERIARYVERGVFPWEEAR